MKQLTRRQGLSSLVAGGLAVAGIAGVASVSARAEAVPAPSPPTTRSALITPEQILRDKVEGDVRAALVVKGWVKYRGLQAGPSEHQTFILDGARVGAERLDVLVGPKVFARLSTIGIEDPRAHFVGKSVVVTGRVHRNPAPGGEMSIILWVNDLAQVESISKTAE
jgi:hypothetical protein